MDKLCNKGNNREDFKSIVRNYIAEKREQPEYAM